ncbi:hypothetical protein C0Q70_15131 [Pomacea canaliculata]|uniref:MJ1316 RNA cyclic group end recognition domain-containing protein n=1 Tax=Pomacea canaliculata TaxID=400727 RepID=A0A2T7NTZ5_POMCA|nr:hypothetical protein C0Q70_15131 [Pomacea canaliculata]
MNNWIGGRINEEKILSLKRHKPKRLAKASLLRLRRRTQNHPHLRILTDMIEVQNVHTEGNELSLSLNQKQKDREGAPQCEHQTICVSRPSVYESRYLHTALRPKCCADRRNCWRPKMKQPVWWVSCIYTQGDSADTLCGAYKGGACLPHELDKRQIQAMACESPVYVSLQSFEVSQLITAFPRKSRVIKDIGSFTYIVTVQLNGGDVSLKLQLTGWLNDRTTDVGKSNDTVTTTGDKKKVSKGKPSGKSGRGNEKTADDKRAPLKTAEDVVNRVLWDDKLKKEDFFVGYLDRFKGTVEKNFSTFSWEDIATVDYNALAIPKHRIQYFKYRNENIWDKASRLDRVFGSDDVASTSTTS